MNLQKELLKLLLELKSSINIDGSFFYEKSKKDDFFISLNKQKKEKYKKSIKAIRQYIKHIVIENFKGDTKGIQLCFSGEINKTEMILDELYVIKNVVDKDKKNITINLFDEDAEDF